MKLTGPMIGTQDSKVLGEFYTKVFGKPVMQQDDWYGFAIGTGMLMVGNHSDVKGQNPEPARIMIMIEAPDVKAEFDRIKGVGATVIAEPYQPDKSNDKIWLATLADPDGNYFQLASPWE